MSIPKLLQGIVIDYEKSGEIKEDERAINWYKCVFTIELTGFSKRTPKERQPRRIKDRRIKVVRYCAYDWHYKIGILKTLSEDETKAILEDKPTESVYW